MRNAAANVRESCERRGVYGRGEVRTGTGVRLADVGAEGEGGGAALEEEDPPDVEEGGAAEGVVAPLVAGRDEGAHEAGDDHDDVHEDDGEDVGEREARVEQELEQEERGRDRPVDVAGVLRDGRSAQGDAMEVEDIPRWNGSSRRPRHEGTRHGSGSRRGRRPWRSRQWRRW
jgi:hypothetical protein